MLVRSCVCLYVCVGLITIALSHLYSYLSSLYFSEYSMRAARSALIVRLVGGEEARGEWAWRVLEQ